MKQSTVSVIKSPKGAALEYAKHSFSAYRHCPNECAYCYLNRGVLSKQLGTGTPELRTCFKSDDDVVKRFEKEIKEDRKELVADGGVFFSFITDPCLKETFSLTNRSVILALGYGVPVTVLTKMTDWVESGEGKAMIKAGGRNVCVGFSLTGRDDLEPYASPNMARVEAMRKVHEYGVHTFASVEPVIDLDDSLDMIKATLGFCDEYKIGLESGKKHNRKPITVEGLVQFVEDVQRLVAEKAPTAKIYWKESITQKVDGLVKFSENVVDASYNIFVER